MSKRHDTIVVLDFGAQYSQLIARRVRELGVYSQILPFNSTPEDILASGDVKGIIFSGGPASVPAAGSPRPDQRLFDMGLPIFGICYGLQVMSQLLGGLVECPEHKEYGIANIDVLKADSPIFKGVSAHSQVWMSHGDRVARLPEGFVQTASTPSCPYTAVEDRKRKFFGVQFHPEVVHSLEGQKMLSNFVLDVCQAQADWNMGSFINEAVESIRAEVGDRQVLCGLSGGVDSSVAAVLIHKAIGDQLVCVFVNNGMLRKGEAESVLSLFGEHFNMRLQYADAEEAFLSALKGKTDPEDKRKTIGKLFIDTFYNEARKCGDISYLAQGTLYPDIVESRSPFGGPTSTI